MGENLKERYPGKGGRATSNYADALFSLPCLSRFARLSTTCLLKKKKEASRRDRMKNRPPAHSYHTDMHTLPTNDSSKKFLSPLSISFPIGQKLGNRHLLRRIQSRGAREGSRFVIDAAKVDFPTRWPRSIVALSIPFQSTLRSPSTTGIETTR